MFLEQSVLIVTQNVSSTGKLAQKSLCKAKLKPEGGGVNLGYVTSGCAVPERSVALTVSFPYVRMLDIHLSDPYRIRISSAIYLM